MITDHNKLLRTPTINSFIKRDLIEKNTEKGKFFFIKTQSKSILVEDLLKKIIPKTIGSISWKKSMKWSEYNLMWGRPLRSIFARFNNKKLPFKFNHLETTDEIIIEQDWVTKTKKIKDSREYFNFLKDYKNLIENKEIMIRSGIQFHWNNENFKNFDNTKIYWKVFLN